MKITAKQITYTAIAAIAPVMIAGVIGRIFRRTPFAYLRQGLIASAITAPTLFYLTRNKGPRKPVPLPKSRRDRMKDARSKVFPPPPKKPPPANQPPPKKPPVKKPDPSIINTLHRTPAPKELGEPHLIALANGGIMNVRRVINHQGPLKIQDRCALDALEGKEIKANALMIWGKEPLSNKRAKLFPTLPLIFQDVEKVTLGEGSPWLSQLLTRCHFQNLKTLTFQNSDVSDSTLRKWNGSGLFKNVKIILRECPYLTREILEIPDVTLDLDPKMIQQFADEIIDANQHDRVVELSRKHPAVVRDIILKLHEKNRNLEADDWTIVAGYNGLTDKTGLDVIRGEALSRQTVRDYSRK